MKKAVIITALTVTLAGVTAVPAGDKPNDGKPPNTAPVEKPKTAQPQASSKRAKVLLTGSYIPQKSKRSGRITDGMSQVVVLDQETIQRSGAIDLKQLLNSQGIH